VDKDNFKEYWIESFLLGMYRGGSFARTDWRKKFEWLQDINGVHGSVWGPAFVNKNLL